MTAATSASMHDIASSSKVKYTKKKKQKKAQVISKSDTRDIVDVVEL